MFYNAESGNKGTVWALLSFTPSESKRLIAKGVAAVPEIKHALAQGTIVVARGITGAFVAEELSGRKIDPKYTYAAGVIAEGDLVVAASETKKKVMVFRKGVITEEEDPNRVLSDFGPEDVYIKGANAVDPDGNCGVLVAGVRGGTIGAAIGTLQAFGVLLLCPVGLEKLVPSITAAVANLGIKSFKYSTGVPVGMVVMSNVRAFTEVQALRVLFGVDAVMVSGGGSGGSEGSVTLSVAGTDEAIERVMKLVKMIKGEPPVPAPPRQNPPARQLGYDAKAQTESLKR